MADVNHPLGRVSTDGIVEVRLHDEWISVGAYPDAPAEEALAHFVRKFEDFEAQVKITEQRFKAKAPVKDLTRSLEKLRKESAEPHGVGDYVSLRARLDALEADLQTLASQQAVEHEAAVEASRLKRQEIVAEIEALAGKPVASIRWKDVQPTINDLFERWKAEQQNGPRIPRAEADELWKRFRNARNSLDRARRAHFQERDKATKESKSIKRELIEKAQALAPKGADGIGAYRALLDEWKKAPRGPRSVDEQLWHQFKAAGDVLYQAKSSVAAAEDEANRENGVAKKQLLDEFKDVTQMQDFRAASERLRQFHERFRKIGPVPRDMVKTIDSAVRGLEAHVKKLETDHWDKTNPEKQARSESFLGQIDQQIEQLERELAEAEQSGSTDRARSLQEELETKRTWRGVLTQS